MPAVKGPLATVTCTAPVAGVTVDVPVLIGNLFGVPAKTAASGESFELHVLGEWELTKQAGVAVAAGGNVYWDSGAGEADIDAANTFIGKSPLGAAGGDATVTVRLMPGLTTAAGGVAATLFNANTILKADADDTPEALTVGEQTLVGRITGGEITALTPAQVRTLLNVEDGADVTDAASVSAAGAVMESDYDANTILAANVDNAPLPLTVGANTLVGRAGANIAALAVPDESLVGRSAGGDIAGQAVAVQSFVGRGAAGLGGIAVAEEALVGRQTGGNLSGIAIADEALVGRTAGGTVGGIAVAASRIVGRTAAGNLGALTAGDVRTLINVESGADVTDETNVLAALAVGATAKDLGGGAVTNVGLVDGRDVSADGGLLDTHLAGGASLHDATEIDFELADASKRTIAAASDTVEAALIDLDQGVYAARALVMSEDFLASSGGTLPQPWAAAEVSPVGAVTQDYVSDGLWGRYAQTCDAQNEAQTARLDWGDSLHINPLSDPVVEFKFIWNPAGAAGDASTDVFVGLASNYNSDPDLIVNAIGLRVLGANMDLLIESDDGVVDASVDTTLNIVKGNVTTLYMDLSDLSAVRVLIDLGAGAGMQTIATTPNISALTGANPLQPAFLLRKSSAATESLVADRFAVWAPTR